MSDNLVEVTLAVSPSPSPHRPRFLGVPNPDVKAGDEIGVFHVIVRGREMKVHGAIVLYLGGHATVDDAQLFILHNMELFQADDFVVVECERLPTIDQALKHVEVMKKYRLTVVPHNIYFFANFRVK